MQIVSQRTLRRYQSPINDTRTVKSNHVGCPCSCIYENYLYSFIIDFVKRRNMQNAFQGQDKLPNHPAGQKNKQRTQRTTLASPQ